MKKHQVGMPFNFGDKPFSEIPEKEAPSIVKTRSVLNRWSVFGLVFGSALLTIIYVSNVIRVNELLRENQVLQKQYENILYRNEGLRTEIVRLRSAGRITAIAQEKLGLVPAQKAPLRLQ